MGVCYCLQTCNSVVYVLVMCLLLGQSLMVISTTGILLYAKVSPLYSVLWECIVVIYTKLRGGYSKLNLGGSRQFLPGRIQV